VHKDLKLKIIRFRTWKPLNVKYLLIDQIRKKKIHLWTFSLLQISIIKFLNFFDKIYRVRIDSNTSDVDQDGEISEQISFNTLTLNSDYSNCVPSTSSSSSSSSTPYLCTTKKIRRSNVASACNIRPINKNRSELITQSICNMICEDMLSHNTV